MTLHNALLKLRYEDGYITDRNGIVYRNHKSNRFIETYDNTDKRWKPSIYLNGLNKSTHFLGKDWIWKRDIEDEHK